MGDEIDLSLDAPSVYLFSGAFCTRAYRLYPFGFACKFPAVLERFATEPEALMNE